MELTDENPSDITLNRLPPSTVKLLSSGQVITSVSTAVKELVENAIDAGATNIEIKLENEGFDKIEVKDNGKGVKREDVAYMCQQRYTSKIKDFDDLEHLSSYGFRGEALSSLCAISQLMVTTKTIYDEVATCYSFDSDGKINYSQLSNLNLGTIITAQDLFKNLPVRKQYLSSGKRKNQELKHVGDIVKSFGLIHPKLRILLTHNKFCVWQKNAVTKLQECLVQVIPFSVAKHLHEINYSDDNLKLQLMLPSKDCYVWNTCYGFSIDATNLFVNLRPVKNKQIEKTVQDEIHQYFGSTIPKNKKPFCLISVTVPTHLVDVNLEPNKTRVLIKEMDYIIKVLKDQLVLYYVGILEPPKSSTDENILESSLKRKNEGNTPVKNKVAKKSVTPKKGKRISLDSSEEANISVNSEGKSSRNASTVVNEEVHERIDDTVSSSMDICQTEIIETDHFENFNGLESFLDNIENEITKSEQSKKNVAVIIQKNKEDSINENDLVGIMSDEDSSDSVSFEMENNKNADFSDSKKRDNATLKNSTQKEVTNKNEKNKDLDKMSELNMKEITLSQWSRGDVSLNNKMIKSSTAIGRKDDLIKRKEISSNRGGEEEAEENSLERSISSQMGCKQMSAFTKFSREMRTKIIEQKPGITFTEVAAELASKWRNLHDKDKRIYENITEENINEKAKVCRVPVKLKDPTYKPQTCTRYNPENSCIKKTKVYQKSISLDLSCEKLRDALNKRVNYSQPESCLISSVEDNLIFINDKGNITLASIERLKESIALHNNLEHVSLSRKFLSTRMPILQSELGHDLWKVLESLDTCFDDTFNTIIVVGDERITKNGFRIEKIPGAQENKYYITDVPSEVELCDIKELKEILEFIQINNVVKPGDCRPTRILNFIKKKTLQDNNFEEMFTNLLDLYLHWSENIKGITRNCPHFRPVCKLLYPLDSYPLYRD